MVNMNYTILICDVHDVRFPVHDPNMFFRISCSELTGDTIVLPSHASCGDELPTLPEKESSVQP